MAERTTTADHARHDLELIARVAAGDGTSADRAAARDLCAACGDCAGLETDLWAIAVGLRALRGAPVEAAPRDFRISPDVASRLRRRNRFGWLAGLVGGGRGRLGPIGGGLVAIGLVGMLIGSGFPGGLASPGVGGAALAPSVGPARAAASTSASTFGTDLDALKNPASAAAIAPAQPAFGQAASASPAPEAAATPAPQPPSSANVTAVVLSAASFVVGLALLLAARARRRSSP